MVYIFKRYSKYILCFIIVFLFLCLFGSSNMDNIWNYGMAHAIKIGEIPYRDFNTVSTPLYPFIMSILLHISDSYTVFLIEQSFLFTILFYFIDKLINNKIIFFFFVIFPIFGFIMPSYNFLVFLLLIILIYLEEKDANDYFIGFILGLMILSKHTIGVVIMLCSLISTHNIKKASKRFFSIICLLFVFLLYLLISDSLLSFLDLCVFGLFDFNSNNKLYPVFFIICSLGLFAYTIYSFLKNKSYLNYYLLGAFSFIIPITDMLHFNYLFCFFVLVFLMKHYFSKSLQRVFFPLFILIFILNIIINFNSISNIKLLTIPKFKSYLVSDDYNSYLNNILKKYKSYDNCYMISMHSMFFDIASNHEITYFDVPLYGNFGYNGISKMEQYINEIHNTYFFIIHDTNRQYANELIDYIENIGEKVDEVEDMDIYFLN